MENIRQVCKELGRKWVQRFLDRKVYLLLSSAFGFFGAWKIVWIMVTFLMSSTKMVQLLFLANLSFAFGLVSLMGYVFHRWNRDWDLYSNRFFAEWVRKQRIIRTVTGVVGGVLLVLAIVNLRYWIEHWERNNVTYRYLPLIALAFLGNHLHIIRYNVVQFLFFHQLHKTLYRIWIASGVFQILNDIFL